MSPITILQLVCMSMVTTMVTCDSNVTKETFSSLQQQVQALQTALLRQNAENQQLKAEHRELMDSMKRLAIDKQEQKDHFEKRIEELKEHFEKRLEDHAAESNELKDPWPKTLQKRVSDATSGIGFSASLSTTTALGDHQIIVFDTVVTNDGNGYDSRHGHFTAPVTGLYAFSVTVMCYGSESYLHVAIIKDSQQIGVAFANGNNSDNGSKLVVVTLQEGQSVWVEHYYDPSGYKIQGSAYSSFSGFLIQAY
ncbi:cerebellin-1-like [Argopecten irradians]|uniref:cerebellin-1-like n=1 Tax=Argopecten irradians TaxID=31199 RepID=UPI003720E1CA